MSTGQLVRLLGAPTDALTGDELLAVKPTGREDVDEVLRAAQAEIRATLGEALSCTDVARVLRHTGAAGTRDWSPVDVWRVERSVLRRLRNAMEA